MAKIDFIELHNDEGRDRLADAEYQIVLGNRIINRQHARIQRLRAAIRAYRAHADVSGPDQWHAVLDAEHALERGDMEDAE